MKVSQRFLKLRKEFLGGKAGVHEGEEGVPWSKAEVFKDEKGVPWRQGKVSVDKEGIFGSKIVFLEV